MNNLSIIPQLQRTAPVILLLIATACTTSLPSSPTSPGGGSAESAKQSSDDDVALEIASLMAGKFNTAPGETENVFSDQRIILQQGPTDGVWLYYQLNTGEERKLYRQRFVKLTTLSRDSVIQHTYRPTKPEQWESIWDQVNASLIVTEADLDSAFEPGCELIWTRMNQDQWRGYVDPKTCEYFSKRRGKNIYIESETVLSAAALKQAERGFDADGGQLFGTEPGEFLQLRRVQ